MYRTAYWAFPVDVLEAFQTHPDLECFSAQKGAQPNTYLQKSGSHPWLLSFRHQHSMSYQALLVWSTCCLWNLSQPLHPYNHCCRSVLFGGWGHALICSFVFVFSVNRADIQWTADTHHQDVMHGKTGHVAVCSGQEHRLGAHSESAHPLKGSVTSSFSVPLIPYPKIEWINILHHRVIMRFLIT